MRPGPASAIAIGLWLVAAVLPAGDHDCLACHGDRELRSDSGGSLHVDAARHKASAHGGLACADCHTGIRELPHPPQLPNVDCATCHAATAKEYAQSVHAAVLKNGSPDGARCTSCHGPAHSILASSHAASRTAKRNLAETCGSCHADPEFLARHRIPFAHPVEAYKLSVHGRAVARGEESAPSCSDCHGSHGIVAARDSRSPINHWNVTATCGACHSDAADSFGASIHGEAARRGVAGAPVCTDCHGEHAILAPSEPRSLVNPARVSSVTCGRCHGDERLAERYNLPKDKVPTFSDSYHGLALRSGSQTVANCASCHGVHNILPSRDPKSTIHPTNLARTCGSCHPGAGQRFAIGSVHVRAETTTEHVIVRWIRLAYLVLIPLTVGFMLAHNSLDFLAKVRRGTRGHDSGQEVLRMGLHFRVAHGLVLLSFPVLVLTGFALKYPDAWWAVPMLQWEGNMAFRGIVHRIAAVVLIASMVYHALHLVLVSRDRVILRQLRLRIQDLKDVWGVTRHNLGQAAVRPRFGKFSYAEKVEYWAFVWGTVVMAVSGFVLWFNNFSLKNLPKWVSDAATAIHWYEAILATLSILIWHFYLVILDPDVYPMERAWLTGKVSADHLKETRPAYYRALMAEATSAPATAVEAKAEGAALAEPAAGPGKAEPEDPEPSS